MLPRISRSCRPVPAFLAIAALAGCTPAPDELRLVTPNLDIDRQIATELARVLHDAGPVSVVLVPNPDPDQAVLQALEDGTADLALVSNIDAFRNGIETVIPLYQTVLHIVYRRGIDPGDGRELLTGTTVYAGPQDSPSRRMLLQAARRIGVAVERIHFVDGIEPRPDVIVLFAPILPRLMQGFEDYRLYSLGTPGESGSGARVDSVSLLTPQLRPFVIPTNTYGLDLPPAPVLTMAVDQLLVARADVPETAVYDLISEILRVKPALSAIQPTLFHQLTGDFDASNSTFVIHAGAQAFLERNAPSVYERYSGVAEVTVTLMLAFISGTIALVRIYNIRRKNRIDTFYSRALAIRRSVGENPDDDARSQAIRSLRDLQEEAFTLLVDEKLAANDSFRIFVTLCDDIIGDMKG